jgi:WD40 repeat protein
VKKLVSTMKLCCATGFLSGLVMIRFKVLSKNNRLDSSLAAILQNTRNPYHPSSPGDTNEWLVQPGFPSMLGVSAVSIIPETTNFGNQTQRPTIIIGTKRGIVLVARIDANDDHPGLQLLGSTTVSEKPVYCLTWSEEPMMDGTTRVRVYAGCGDRYVSVLEATTASNHETQCLLHQTTVKKLGPHTGWVKGLVVAPTTPSTFLLYSIGCNRIQGWNPDTWKTAGTVSIGSAVEGTCTLSSDLLCLTTIATNNKDRSLVVAGGVDGRIHFFRHDLFEVDDDDSWPSCISAHQGRVNSLCFEPTSGILFSASSDATIGCWTMVKGYKGATNLAFLNVSNKVLCCSSWHDKSNVFVAAGTNDGSVEIFAASADETHQQYLKFQKLHHVQMAGQPAINAVKPIRLGAMTIIAVGHSNGFHLCPELGHA